MDSIQTKEKLLDFMLYDVHTVEAIWRYLRLGACFRCALLQVQCKDIGLYRVSTLNDNLAMVRLVRDMLIGIGYHDPEGFLMWKYLNRHNVDGVYDREEDGTLFGDDNQIKSSCSMCLGVLELAHRNEVAHNLIAIPALKEGFEFNTFQITFSASPLITTRQHYFNRIVME